MKYIFACGLDIFIDYLACIVCIAIEWEEALFCHDFWPLLGYGKSGKKIINYQCFNRTKMDKSGGFTESHREKYMKLEDLTAATI